MLKCSVCDREFGSKRCLNRHMIRIHDPNYKPPSPKKCEICGLFRANLRQHFILNHSTDPKHLEQKEQKRLASKKHFEENKEKYAENRIKWRKKNPEKLKIARDKWREKNKEAVRLKNREYSKQPVECKICGKIYTRNYLRRHIKICINGNTKPKMGNTKPKITRVSKTHLPVKKISEIDKLRQQIKKAEEKNEIKKNLTIKSNVILEW